MLARRLLFLVAAMMVVTFVASVLAPRPVTEPIEPPPTPNTGGAAAPAKGVVELRLDASAGRPRTVDARVGETVQLTVEGDTADGVLIDGLDQIRFMEPLTPAVFELRLDRAGEFPIVLMESQETVGSLNVASG